MKNILIICIAVVFFSCKKNANLTLPTPNIPNSITTTVQDSMFPLSIGNYWIYQKSTDDTSGNYSMINEIDSVYIVKDTMMMGEHRFKIAHSNHLSQFNLPFNNGDYFWIKDSLGFLRTYHEDFLLLDNIHIGDTIQTTSIGPAFYYNTVPDTFSNRSFYIGNFSGLWMKEIAHYPAVLSQYTGLYTYRAFVKNIGLVRTHMFFSGVPTTSMFSYHLIRYHIN